jgi:hypothetical protein
MLDDDFFDGNPEGHCGPFFKGKVEYVLRRLGHGVRNDGSQAQPTMQRGFA